MSKILIVDDKAANLELIVTFLGNKGYKCLIAKNGKDAITRAENTLPDIILLDVQMPEMDGFETCSRLKLNEITSGIPVIFMTALNDTADKVQGFDVGAVDYITKPIDSEELLARVETHLTIHKLRSDLEKTLKVKDELLRNNLKKTEELIATQKELFKSEKIAALGYLVSGIAHELNTPLGIAITSSSQASYEIKEISKKLVLSDPDFKNSLNSIMTCNDLTSSNLFKLENLVKKFKDLSQTKSTLVVESLNIKKFIEECLIITKCILETPDIKIIINSNDYIVKNINSDAIESIINNLYENSVMHGFKNKNGESIVDISVTYKDNELILEYKDNGTGIKEDIVSKIFDPFFTANKSRGTGLGLSIVHNIVTQVLKGKIEYVSGSTGAHFVVVFPADVSL